MGTVSFDFHELEEYRDRLSKLQVDSFLSACAKELAARLLRKVIKRTPPVGTYPKGSGKTGGTLKRGWTGAKEDSALAFAQSIPVEKSGNVYRITISNSVYYAPYVEYGHRKRNGGWCEGKFMLTIAEQELTESAPAILEQKLNKFLKEALID